MRLWLYFYYYGKYISHDDECSYLRVLVEDNGETNTHVIPSLLDLALKTVRTPYIP